LENLNNYAKITAMNNVWPDNEILLKKLTSLAKRLSASPSQAPSSLIFAGSAGLGKRAAADLFARVLFCSASRSAEACGICPACRQLGSGTFPDVLRLAKDEEKKFLDIDSVRDFIAALNLSVLSGPLRLGIIDGAESLNEASANALLKTLEEPKSRALVLLLTDNLEALPKTISSRSQVFMFRAASSRSLQQLLSGQALDKRRVSELAALSQGKVEYLRALLATPELTQQRLQTAAVLWQAPTLSLSDRLAAVEGLALESGVKGAGQAEDVLSLWQLVVRDWLCWSLNLPELTSFAGAKETLAAGAERLGRPRILAAGRRLFEARQQLRANVSAKAVLENLLINFDTYA
jgi:DNA polymerase-3 subunit delta'